MAENKKSGDEFNARKRKAEAQNNNGKVKKVDVEPSNSDNESSGREEPGPLELPKNEKAQNNLLMDAFLKLYAHFDEDDLEMKADIMNLLNALEERKCVSAAEYGAIEAQLNSKSSARSYEAIDSTIDNMTEDDKQAVLGLLNSMPKNKAALKMIPTVKKYFREEMELDTVLNLLFKLRDKANEAKLAIILKNIERTRNRVKEIFNRLKDGADKEEKLKFLRSYNYINDEQYEKLLIAPHNLTSISNIVQGRGMYLSRRWYQ